MTNIFFREDYELSLNNSLKLRSIADKYISVDNVSLIPEIIDLVAGHKFLILGSATNTILPDRYNGVIIQLVNQNIEHQYDLELGLELIKVASGVLWDQFVHYSLENGFFGLENLSGIPGTIGSCPVQNIGAYGVEVGSYIHSVDVYDIATRNFCTLSNQECDFKYRSSIFKGSNRYIILSVCFLLDRNDKPDTHYLDLQKYTGKVNAKQLRDIVIEIRNSKLPSLDLLPNVGSFFQNPIISKQEYERLLKLDQGVVAFKNVDDNNIKISAGYLIEKAGLKPFFMHGFSVYHKHALIVVNYNHAGQGTQLQLLELAHYVQQKVFDKYKVHIHIEPNIIS
jgi:UDP-N-acetylmuramate dehydrogenase